MNLKKVRLEKEDKDFFHLHDGKSSFKVAKRGLSPEMHGHIAQHFANGGKAQAVQGRYPLARFANGGEADMDTVPDPSEDFKKDLDVAGAQSQQTADALQGLPVQTYGWESGNAFSSPPGLEPHSIPKKGEALPPALRPYIAAETTGADTAKKKGPEEEEVPASAAPPAPPPVAPAAPAMPKVGGLPDVSKEVGQSFEDESAAQMRAAQAQAQQSREQARLQEEGNKRAAAISKETQDKFAGYQARADALSADIANFKVDANRLWKSQSTGQRVMGTIAMVLGGFASGLTGGPNVAMQMMDKAIERDIDEQKMELGKKENALSRYIQQGHDALEAGRLAKADAQDATAGQLLAAAYKSGDEKALAAGQAAAAGLKRQAALSRQAIAAENLKGKLTAIQVALAQQSMASAGQQNQVMEALRRGTLDPRLEAQLPEAIRKNIIHVTEDRVVGKDAGGNPLTRKTVVPRLALDEKRAEKAVPEFESNDLMRSRVAAIEAFIKEHPDGTLSPQASQQAAAMVNDLKLSWLKAQEGVGRLNDREADMLDQMIKDPSKIWASATGRTGAATSALRKLVNQKRQSLEAAYLVPNG